MSEVQVNGAHTLFFAQLSGPPELITSANVGYLIFGETFAKRQIAANPPDLHTEKTKGRRRIQDLQTEVCDGTILCEVIEAVTQQKVPDVNRKPKNNSTMVTNIQACLNFLLAKVHDI